MQLIVQTACCRLVIAEWCGSRRTINPKLSIIGAIVGECAGFAFTGLLDISLIMCHSVALSFALCVLAPNSIGESISSLMFCVGSCVGEEGLEKPVASPLLACSRSFMQSIQFLSRKLSNSEISVGTQPLHSGVTPILNTISIVRRIRRCPDEPWEEDQLWPILFGHRGFGQSIIGQSIWIWVCVEDARLRPIRLRTIRLLPAVRNRIGRSQNWPKSNRWCLLCFFFFCFFFFFFLFFFLKKKVS